MWKHEILGMLDKKIKKPDNDDPALPYFLQTLRSNIEKAPCFYFGDAEDMSSTGTEANPGKLDVRIRLPYPFVMYEFESAVNGIMVEKFDNGQNENFLTNIEKLIASVGNKKIKNVLYAEEQNTDNSLTLMSFSYIENKWEPWKQILHITRNPLGTGEFQVKNIGYVSEEDREKHTAFTYYNAWVLSTLTDILNCSNIVTKNVVPPEALNRKRIRKGNLPLYSYKILEVVKGKAQTRNAGDVPWGYKSQEHNRFSLCRGHFKTFTEERPLFGKWSGTFWWNAQARGNKEKGSIEKDYTVKVADE